MTEADELARDPNVDYTDQSWAVAGLPPIRDRSVAQQLMEVQDDPEALLALAIELGVIEGG